MIGVGNSVAYCALVCEDLVVVAAGRGLVAEEVDRLVGNAVGLLCLVLEVAQAVGLVPAVGEHIEGDLASNGEATGFRSAQENNEK